MVWIKKQKTTAHAHARKTCKTQKQPVNPISSGVALHSPCELDILVDRAGNHHGDDGVVPGAEEHESETQAHPQERQSPVEMDKEVDRSTQRDTDSKIEAKLKMQTFLPVTPELTSGRT